MNYVVLSVDFIIDLSQIIIMCLTLLITVT